MLFAAIDIGSNAARLLFANAYRKAGVIKIDKASIIRIPTRLGEDVYKDQIISPSKARNFIKTMQAFKLLIDVYDPVSFKVYATAAMREAKNSEAIIKKVKKETGLKIKVIDGKKEADIIRSVSKLLFPLPKPYTLHMDMGGGSTELSVEKDGKLIKQKSFKIGTLRMLSGKVYTNILEDMTKWICTFSSSHKDFQMIGTGGNINKLCKVFGNIDNKQLSISQLEKAHTQLKSLNINQRIKTFGFRPDRADVIEPAAFLYLFMMKKLKMNSIFVPRIGLTNGLILKQYVDFLERNDL
ncbi:MAG: exopolyphosphatase [Bacteroidetes bacterium 4572_77]|nr:MAG: exopolyphosphatase [Bacteroidetes bacterium 4572_77]